MPYIQRITLFAAISAVTLSAIICLLSLITYHEMVLVFAGILGMVLLLAFFDIISDDII